MLALSLFIRSNLIGRGCGRGRTGRVLRASPPGRLHQRDAQVEQSGGVRGRWELGGPPKLELWGTRGLAPWSLYGVCRCLRAP